MSRDIFVMSMMLQMAPCYSLGLNNQNDVQHAFFGHVMPLALTLASDAADSIVR